MMILLISVGVFLTLCILILLIYQLATAEKRVVSGRLDQAIKSTTVLTGSKSVEYQEKGPVGLRGVLRKIGYFVESPRWNLSLEHRILKAGLPLKGGEFLVLCGGSALLMAMMLILVGGGRPVAGMIGAVVGFTLPFLFLNIKTAKRRKTFNSQLGDALILIANSLRTGYSFMQAANMVAQEMRPPISTEFARTVKEMNLGITMENALENLAKRIDLEDLDLVLTAVLIQRQVGGNLSEVLDNISKTIRERVRIRSEIRTMTAQGRISGLIVSLLPVALGLIIYAMNPEYIKVLFVQPVGRLMLGVALAGQVIGILVIRRIVDIEI
jgi:tight adherence protein B